MRQMCSLKRDNDGICKDIVLFQVSTSQVISCGEKQCSDMSSISELHGILLRNVILVGSWLVPNRIIY